MKKIDFDKVRLIILAQREENYGWYDGSTSWKQKGGQEFTFDVNSSILMYCEDQITDWIKNTLLPLYSSNCFRYTFISLEKQFSLPIDTQDLFDTFYREKMQKQNND